MRTLDQSPAHRLRSMFTRRSCRTRFSADSEINGFVRNDPVGLVEKRLSWRFGCVVEKMSFRVVGLGV